MILPSDPLVVPQSGFRRLVGSDQIRLGPVSDSSTWDGYLTYKSIIKQK